MVLVAYYSRKGHVKKIAESYAGKNGYELYEIKDTVNRDGLFGFMRAGRQAMKKIATPIEPVAADLASYEKVVVCGPVWAGTFACPIRTFLQDYGSSINAVEYILVSGGKEGAYQGLFAEMDGICGKKHLRGQSLSQRQSLTE